jgi:hypothetical protein
MTDAAMICWLRENRDVESDHGSDDYAAVFAEIADRLEALTTPPDRPPVSAAREAELREHCRGLLRCTYLAASEQAALDLLALLDYHATRARLAESVAADLCSDNEALVQVGVAKVVSAIQQFVASLRQGSDEAARLAFTLGGLTQRLVAERPADLPPHLKTIQKQQKQEEALRLVIVSLESARTEDAVRIAKEALGDN